MNPFEVHDIDPREGPAAITERFRELLEDAATDEEKERLRAAWEELTLHPMRRVRAAFDAFPPTPVAPSSVALSSVAPSSVASARPAERELRLVPVLTRSMDLPPSPTHSIFRKDPILFPPRK